ncbi:hypothetical protein Hanom_Chr05g00453871 [Helianthus anomalus]
MMQKQGLTVLSPLFEVVTAISGLHLLPPPPFATGVWWWLRWVWWRTPWRW